MISHDLARASTAMLAVIAAVVGCNQSAAPGTTRDGSSRKVDSGTINPIRDSGLTSSIGDAALAVDATTRAVDDAGLSGDIGPSGEAGPDAGAPVRSSGPGDWSAGDYPPQLRDQTYLELANLPGQSGLVRQYKVHVPPSYDPEVPMAVVYCIHGLGQNAVMFCADGAHFIEKADAEGFILVMPNGYQSSWNAGTCCGGASSMQLDEVAFIRETFDEVTSHLNVDLDRVFATGLSNGGFMAYRLACDAADLFAAVAPGSGAVGTNTIGYGTNPFSDFTDCAPSHPISVLHIHGTSDGIVPYSLLEPSIAILAEADGCDASRVPATRPASAGDTTCETYPSCKSGIEVTQCSVQSGGHVWFGSANCGTGADGACSIVGANSDTLVNTDVIWDFFERHSARDR